MSWDLEFEHPSGSAWAGEHLITSPAVGARTEKGYFPGGDAHALETNAIVLNFDRAPWIWGHCRLLQIVQSPTEIWAWQPLQMTIVRPDQICNITVEGEGFLSVDSLEIWTSRAPPGTCLQGAGTGTCHQDDRGR